MRESASSSPNVRDYRREGDADEDAAFRFAAECRRAEKAALRLIARAEQCSAGLARKLEKRRFSSESVSAVITRLSELKLVDDSRYSRLWLETRLRLARTPRRLLAALCGRGIDRAAAALALKTVLDEDTEYAVLERFAAKCRRKRTREEAAAPAALKHLLKNEGFTRQAITRFTEENHLT